ncbi:MAG TPA: hypothetical protein VN622_08970 [Clostridia bacterium]|nr:hypothetical protein [Clostridia bacterium]
MSDNLKELARRTMDRQCGEGDHNTRFETVSEAEWKRASQRRHADVVEALEHLLDRAPGATVKIPVADADYKAKLKIVLEYARRRALPIRTARKDGYIYIRSVGSKAEKGS